MPLHFFFKAQWETSAHKLAMIAGLWKGTFCLQKSCGVLMSRSLFFPTDDTHAHAQHAIEQVFFNHMTGFIQHLNCVLLRVGFYLGRVGLAWAPRMYFGAAIVVA